MLAPGMFTAGASGLGSLFGGMNPIASRALLGGGLNSLAQLSQEGNEGDLNLMSAGLGALSGAMTAPKADYATNLRSVPYKDVMTDTVIKPGFLERTGAKGMNFLSKGSDIFRAGTGSNLGLNMDTLKAAALPASTAIGDAMYQEAKVAEKDYERALREYNEEQEAMGTASNEGRRQAIISKR